MNDHGQSIIEYLALFFVIFFFCILGTPFFANVKAALLSHFGVAAQRITAP
ncbi:MAG: hypothetical protein HY597_04305 [Candidatus Omnitrophica bacterium]|nr:hypothetical protein [Candidatus Omnitrophota bacterium]